MFAKAPLCTLLGGGGGGEGGAARGARANEVAERGVLVLLGRRGRRGARREEVRQRRVLSSFFRGLGGRRRAARGPRTNCSGPANFSSLGGSAGSSGAAGGRAPAPRRGLTKRRTSPPSAPPATTASSETAHSISPATRPRARSAFAAAVGSPAAARCSFDGRGGLRRRRGGGVGALGVGDDL